MLSLKERGELKKGGWERASERRRSKWAMVRHRRGWGLSLTFFKSGESAPKRHIKKPKKKKKKKRKKKKNKKRLGGVGVRSKCGEKKKNKR